MQTIEEIPPESEVAMQSTVENEIVKPDRKQIKEPARFSFRKMIWRLLIICLLTVGAFVVLVGPLIAC
jgi:hypothetical protein